MALKNQQQIPFEFVLLEANIGINNVPNFQHFEQDGNLTCWAVCLRMLLNYHFGNQFSECDIVTERVGLPCCNAAGRLVSGNNCDVSIDPANIVSFYQGRPFYLPCQETVISNVDELKEILDPMHNPRRTVAIKVGVGYGFEHLMIIYGYSIYDNQETYFAISDPLEDSVHNVPDFELKYSELEDWDWEESFIINKL